MKWVVFQLNFEKIRLKDLLLPTAVIFLFSSYVKSFSSCASLNPGVGNIVI